MIFSEKIWKKIYRRNVPKLIGICRRYVGDNHIAEDIVHDAFLTAVEKYSTLKEKERFESWLCRIVVNSSLMYLRKKKNELEKINIMKNDFSIDNFQNEIVEEEYCYFSSKNFSRNELLEIIDKLPEHHKTVFNLYVIDNFSHSQIADLLNISEGTSKSHLARARKKIRFYIEQQITEKENQEKNIFALMFFKLTTEDKGIDKLFKIKFKNFSIKPEKSIYKSKNFDIMKTFAAPNYHLKMNYLRNIFLILLISVSTILLICNLNKTIFLKKSNLILFSKAKINKKNVQNEDYSFVEENENNNESQVTEFEKSVKKNHENSEEKQKEKKSKVWELDYSVNWKKTDIEENTFEKNQNLIKIYKNIEDFNNDSNYQVVELKIFSEIEKVSKKDSIETYDFDVEKDIRKDEYSEIFGFVYNDQLYVNPYYPKKISHKKHFSKAEIIGNYLYYTYIDEVVYTTGQVTIPVSTIIGMLIDLETGENFQFTTRKLKKIIKNNDDLYEKFKKEKAKNSKLKLYLEKFFE